jgi:hypothetical protein
MANRGSYARRNTETKRDEKRETLRANRIDAHEQQAIREILDGCERFQEERGLTKKVPDNDFRRITVTVTILGPKPDEGPRFRRKEQQPCPSLKEIELRKLVAKATRRENQELEMTPRRTAFMEMVRWASGFDDEDYREA